MPYNLAYCLVNKGLSRPSFHSPTIRNGLNTLLPGPAGLHHGILKFEAKRARLSAGLQSIPDTNLLPVPVLHIALPGSRHLDHQQHHAVRPRRQAVRHLLRANDEIARWPTTPVSPLIMKLLDRAPDVARVLSADPPFGSGRLEMLCHEVNGVAGGMRLV